METLQLHNVSKNFGKKKVLQDISFQLQTGEILGLFGRNGSGKSTLLKILFGKLKATNAVVTINGNPVKTSNIIPKQWIAYLPQHPFLPKNLKVRDCIPIFHNNQEAQDRIFYDPHIASMTAKQIGSLSLGELKYLEVMLLSYLPHPFLMLDEPFSMLEPLHKEKLKSNLTHLKTTKGIIITDHYYQDVLQISTQNMIIKNGKGIIINDKEDLKEFGYITTKN